MGLEHSSFVFPICLRFGAWDLVLRPGLGFVVLLVLLACGAVLAAEDAADANFQLVAGLLGDKDRQVRAVGLQYVRTGAKGEAATRRFAAMLPDLPPEAQADLVAALADRGDRVARPQVLALLASREDAGPHRGGGGNRHVGRRGRRAGAVTVLASAATPRAGGRPAKPQPAPRPEDERPNRRPLPGQRVPGGGESLFVSHAEPAEAPEVRALLDILAARNATDTADAVLATARRPEDASVRAAALAALRVLADPGRTAAIVKLPAGRQS